MKHYIPQIFISRERNALNQVLAEYELEYLHHPNISELTLFGNLPLYRLTEIFGQCLKFLQHCDEVRPDVKFCDVAEGFCKRHFDFLVRDKTLARLKQFQDETGFDVEAEIVVNGNKVPGLRQMAEILISEIAPTRPEDITFWHGDFFFGNILYDARARVIRVIDPRGEAYKGRASIYGDRRYDRAKLLHSLIGLYDVIVAGRCAFYQESSTRFSIEFGHENDCLIDLARRAFVGEEPLLNRESFALTILLFISMLPLHAEDSNRQACLLANAARLYNDFRCGEWS